MELTEYLESERARGEAYQALSKLYFPPDENIGTALTELATALAGIENVGCLAAALPKDATNSQALLIDHTALFIGPFQLLAPPYGSVYLEGKREVMGASTVDAQRRYELAGLNIAKENRDAPDHIAIELEFMYYLNFRQCEAVQRGELSTAEEWLALQSSFLERHLGAWVSQFADRVQQNATTDFYRNLAATSVAFILLDRNYLADPAQSGIYNR